MLFYYPVTKESHVEAQSRRGDILLLCASAPLSEVLSCVSVSEDPARPDRHRLGLGDSVAGTDTDGELPLAGAGADLPRYRAVAAGGIGRKGGDVFSHLAADEGKFLGQFQRQSLADQRVVDVGRQSELAVGDERAADRQGEPAVAFA